MEIVEFKALTEGARTQLEGDEDDPFSARGSTLQWRQKDRHVALRDGDGRLVASAGLVLAQVEAGGGEAFAVVGIGGVIVAAPYRGRGLARRVVEAALARGAAMGPELAMLFCHADRAGLYERLGFATIPPPVLVEQPGDTVEIPQLAMWRALRPGATWPPGRVVLRGLPF